MPKTRSRRKSEQSIATYHQRLRQYWFDDSAAHTKFCLTEFSNSGKDELRKYAEGGFYYYNPWDVNSPMRCLGDRMLLEIRKEQKAHGFGLENFPCNNLEVADAKKNCTTLILYTRTTAVGQMAARPVGTVRVCLSRSAQDDDKYLNAIHNMPTLANYRNEIRHQNPNGEPIMTIESLYVMENFRKTEASLVMLQKIRRIAEREKVEHILFCADVELFVDLYTSIGAQKLGSKERGSWPLTAKYSVVAERIREICKRATS